MARRRHEVRRKRLNRISRRVTGWRDGQEELVKRFGHAKGYSKGKAGDTHVA